MKKSFKILTAFIAMFGIGIFLLPFSADSPSPLAQSRSTQGDNPNNSSVQTPSNEPTIAGPYVATLSQPVRDMIPVATDPVLDREVSPRQPLGGITEAPPIDPNWQDPVRQTSRGADVPDSILSFDGLNFSEGGAGPSDVSGYVGKDHYIQTVNATKFKVWDKQGNLLTPTALNVSSLWTSTGCQSSSAGDAAVVYDHLADRWIFAQFRSGFANGFCIAISTSPDPLDTYFGYEITTPTFPDYFKIGVWPDGYYIGANQSGNNVHALDRDAMLAGNPVTRISFTATNVGNFSMILPSDVDGTPPPAGTPNYFAKHVESGTNDALRVYEFHVDWDTPGNSTFTGPLTLPVANYNILCGFSFSCIQQPSTSQRVDSVTEWLMYRLQYRNFGTHESIVANHAVNMGGDQAGVRWYELRKVGAGDWEIYQESTFAPDSTSRWMAGIAMDGNGNIGLGYNVSSGSVFPGVRYTGRLATDPLNTLRNEKSFVEGGGSQTGTNRWSDYVTMSVDPVDDCTFWYTAEYYANTASVGWCTRIGSFKFPECQAVGGEADLDLTKTANAGIVSVGDLITYTLEVENQGTISATDVILTDAGTAGTTFVSVDPAGNCSEVANIVTCDLGDMDDGEAETVIIVVMADIAGIYTNTASVSTNANEPNTSNNTATATVTIVDYGVNVMSSKSISGAPGSSVVHTLTIFNTGSMADTFDLTVGGNGWTTTPNQASVTIGAGLSATVDVTVMIPPNAGNSDSDSATITATSQGNNAVSDSATITTIAVVDYEYYLPLLTR